MTIDTHFHIFRKNDSQSTTARYTVNYDAAFEDWCKVSKPNAIEAGILIQPSFLGFDNDYLLGSIKQNPKILKGVAVVRPNTTYANLSKLKEEGITGVRLNLAGEQYPIKVIEDNRNLIALLQGLAMHLEINHDNGHLNEILLEIPSGVDIVIDHFGRPQKNQEFMMNNSGIKNHIGRLWVKLSATYRLPTIDHQALFDYWLNVIGPTHLLWGSDWPHTQFENQENYAKQLEMLLQLTSDDGLLHQILSANPKALYWNF
jgi:predicted TIM-barrel fold metal-dependent hydrolase